MTKKTNDRGKVDLAKVNLVKKPVPVHSIQSSSSRVCVKQRKELKRGEKLLPIGSCVIYNPHGRTMEETAASTVSKVSNLSAIGAFTYSIGAFTYLWSEPTVAILFDREWIFTTFRKSRKEITYRLIDYWLFAEKGVVTSDFVQDGIEEYKLIRKGTLGGDTIKHWHQVLERKINLPFLQAFSNEVLERGDLNFYLPTNSHDDETPKPVVGNISEDNDHLQETTASSSLPVDKQNELSTIMNTTYWYKA